MLAIKWLDLSVFDRKEKQDKSKTRVVENAERYKGL